MTVTVAVVSGILGPLACITVVPELIPVTGTATLVAFAEKVTVAGTVATDVLVELSEMVKPRLGAGPDKVRVRFCVPVPEMLSVGGEKLREAVTATLPVEDV